jgi:hypothetical protein
VFVTGSMRRPVRRAMRRVMRIVRMTMRWIMLVVISMLVIVLVLMAMFVMVSILLVVFAIMLSLIRGSIYRFPTSCQSVHVALGSAMAPSMSGMDRKWSLPWSLRSVDTIEQGPERKCTQNSENDSAG